MFYFINRGGIFTIKLKINDKNESLNKSESFKRILKSNKRLVLSDDEIESLIKIIDNIYERYSVTLKIEKNDIYDMFIKDILNILLNNFTYVEIVNLIYNIGNSILLGGIGLYKK